jgi:membrane-bound lytic murein transglycosylase D
MLILRDFFRAALVALALAGVAPATLAADSATIWPRIASGMRIVDAEQPDTVTWARRYAAHPDEVAQMLARSEPFLWYIVESVEVREMPLEIALLPAVESGFNPNARSQQKARGLWQFVPWTGRALGLADTLTYDARRDPITSTRAALNYLQSLHNRFGDWLLAVAAYNVGEARLAAAMKDRGSAAFWDLDLPTETREHVPRLLGVALLVMQPQRFHVKLPAIANRQTGELVALGGARDVAAAARQAKVSLSTIQRYNPGLKNSNNSRGKKALLLPPEDAARMRRELARNDYKAKPVRGQIEHVVKAGDSLWGIAHRYQVSVKQLLAWNDLPAKPKLKPGRKLMVVLEG